MRRLSVAVLLLTFVALLLVLAATSPSAPAGQPGEGQPREGGPAPAASAPAPLAALYKKSTFPAVADPKTTLQDALDGLAKGRGVTFVINDRAFRYEMLKDVANAEVVATAGLPTRETTLARRLQQVLDRINVPSGATFAVRNDHVEITTRQFLTAEVVSSNEVAPADADSDEPPQTITVPLVNLVVERVPLDAALRQLGEQVDYSLSLDPRVGEKARMPVSARLLNTPLDSALLVLAEMAELRPVRFDNLFFVTTSEKADKLPAAWLKYKPKKKRALDVGPLSAAAGGM